jgi:hypothetical protein
MAWYQADQTAFSPLVDEEAFEVAEIYVLDTSGQEP